MKQTGYKDARIRVQQILYRYSFQAYILRTGIREMGKTGI